MRAKIVRQADPFSPGPRTIVAGGYPVKPPPEWFKDPELKEPTPFTVTADGRAFGHVAAWETRHIGMPGDTRPPRSRSNYAYFHTGVVACADGSDAAVGQLTIGGGHAPLSADASAAVAHYDDTGTAVVDLHVGEDAYGIWAAGAVRPGVKDDQVRALRASAPSGDWRPINGNLELVGILQVNVPGFPLARARVAGGAPLALVAAGAADMMLRRYRNIDPEHLEHSERIGELETQIQTLTAAAKSNMRDRVHGVQAGGFPDFLKKKKGEKSDDDEGSDEENGQKGEDTAQGKKGASEGDKGASDGDKGASSGKKGMPPEFLEQQKKMKDKAKK